MMIFDIYIYIYRVGSFNAVTAIYIIPRSIYAKIQNKDSRRLTIYLLRPSNRYAIGSKAYGWLAIVHVFDLSNWQLKHSTAYNTSPTNFVFEFSFRNLSYTLMEHIIIMMTLSFIPVISNQNSEIMEIIDAKLGEIIQPCAFWN